VIAVVGAGVMGGAAAWALRARGADVTLYEQFEPGTPRGSSHGRTRIFRLAYPDPGWVELAQEALAGWRELERQSGRELLELHGLMELASTPELTSRGTLAALSLEHELLDARGARSHGVELPPGWAALLQPDAGVVRADEALDAFLSGADVERRRIDSLDELAADVVVVTAGPWIRRLVPDLPVRVTRETVAYFGLDGPPIPAVVELDEATRGHAMYALHDPLYGIKAGVHRGGHEADPDVEEPARPELVDRIVAWVRSRLPDVDPEPVAVETCLYTSTWDESFVLERRGRVVVGSACSGHGFKFAPAVGRRLAELALPPVA
jgi:sarcosine oxidase